MGERLACSIRPARRAEGSTLREDSPRFGGEAALEQKRGSMVTRGETCRTGARPTLLEDCGLPRSRRVLRRTVLDCARRDQMARRAYRDALQSCPEERAGPNTAAWWRVVDVDEANLEVLVPLLARHGWLGSHLVGADGTHACWQLVQHAPPPYRRRYLPLLATAVARGHASAADLAHLHDRVSVDRRRPQAFGTQSLAMRGGPRRLWPIEHGVNIRRAAAGLPALSAAELAATWAPGDLRRLGIITRARCC